jgi:hypothetical protein
MRGSFRSAVVAALFCVGIMAGAAPSAIADDDDGDTGVQSDDSSGDSDSEDFGNPAIVEPNRELAPPQPVEGAPVDESTRDDEDQDDRNSDAPGFDFDVSAPDLLEGSDNDD